jgi:hypothetical protein
MGWSEAEVEAILEQMRAGATVQSGGGRCHRTYSYRDGSWGYEDFDEGHTEEGGTDEASIRSLIAREPQLFRELLVAPHWRRFSTAFLAGDRIAARELLGVALAYGDHLDQGKVLDAVLAWPETAPSDELVSLIRSKLSSLTAYHVFMSAAGWDHSPGVGIHGVAFADQLIAMAGEIRGCHYLRAAFHEQAGDLAAAERDMLAELQRVPAEDWHRSPFQEGLERLRELARAAR